MTSDLVFKKLTGRIGAIVEGLDLRQPVGDAVVDALRAGLYRHHVLFLRNQDIDEHQQLAFARQFGELELRTPHGRTPDFIRLEDTAENPPKADHWHTDHSCLKDPPGIAFLWADKIPDYGGDTMWVNLCAIYEALSPPLRAFADQLKVRHGVGGRYRVSATGHWLAKGMSRQEIDARFEELEKTVFAVHPMVRTHPVSGKQALFLSPTYVEQIEGLSRMESDWILEYFNRYLDDAHFQLRWRWREKDLAIWDEATTNHRALDDHFVPSPQYRLMRRCTVAGAAPFHEQRGTVNQV